MVTKYTNQIPTTMDNSFSSLISMIRDYRRLKENRRPIKPLPVVPFEPCPPADERQARVIWFGHSTLLLDIEGKRLLLDPMLGAASSPFPIFSSKRYSGKLPIESELMGPIDAVILTHNHYDHLDRGSIMKLKDHTGHFHVPVGVGRCLVKWGVAPEKISEHSWWDEFVFKGLTFACTPARHFSGRGLMDRDRSLWCSWVIAGSHNRIYFSGDSGYAPHFQEIGSKYGPFDLTLMESGQYDERWSAIHMMPEETVQAHLDVKGALMIPIHWGAFTLALHAWTDPIERVVAAAMKQNIKLCTPRIGESVVVRSSQYPTSAWWKEH